MWGTILYVLGIVCAVWCVYDIFTTAKCGLLGKIIASILVLAFSWIGFAIYYFLVRGKI
ncbi:MAG: hypothetical protein II928_05075 [Paludibacteraceae bacterium]|nr:hypothetical protein [Paludibacteraceae bacterium]